MPPEFAREADAPAGYVRLAESVRSGVVESVHHGAVAVMDADGRLVAHWGDPDLVTYPRSSLKPIQAVGLVESGAFDALGLEERHLALACASHYAEPEQVAIVTDWLGRLGLTEEALVCGPALPRSSAAAEAHIRAGGRHSRVFYNCSGKHCGFLSVARHRNQDLARYDDPAHPAQRLYFEVLGELLGRDPSSLSLGMDGCTLPAVSMSLREAALAFARFAALRVADEGRRAAIRRIQGAMRERPDLLAGAGHATEIITRGTGGRVLLKGGAEAFLAAFVPDMGLGIALKVADGTARGRMPALVQVLRLLGVIDAATFDELLASVSEPVTDSLGRVIGGVRACALEPVG